MTNRITLTRPDDWHLHLRDGEVLRAVVMVLIVPNPSAGLPHSGGSVAAHQRAGALQGLQQFGRLCTQRFPGRREPGQVTTAVLQPLGVHRVAHSVLCCSAHITA